MISPFSELYTCVRVCMYVCECVYEQHPRNTTTFLLGTKSLLERPQLVWDDRGRTHAPENKGQGKEPILVPPDIYTRRGIWVPLVPSVDGSFFSAAPASAAAAVIC